MRTFADTWHLQDLIGAWRGHAFPQGLTSAPQWLAIRLFESGRMQKLRSEMMWSDHVNMPLFIGDNLETHDVPYEFTAFAIFIWANTFNLDIIEHFCTTGTVGACITVMMISAPKLFVPFSVFLGMCTSCFSTSATSNSVQRL